MAVVLLYITMGMLVTVVAAFISTVVGDEPGPWQLMLSFFCWPLVLLVMFVYALEGSK